MNRSHIDVAIRLVLSALLLVGATLSVRAQTTAIKRLVVIFQENVSFDHYFATYPNALNPPGQPAFSRQTGNAVRQRTDGHADCIQSEFRSAISAGSLAGGYV